MKLLLTSHLNVTSQVGVKLVRLFKTAGDLKALWFFNIRCLIIIKDPNSFLLLQY